MAWGEGAAYQRKGKKHEDPHPLSDRDSVLGEQCYWHQTSLLDYCSFSCPNFPDAERLGLGSHHWHPSPTSWFRCEFQKKLQVRHYSPSSLVYNDFCPPFLCIISCVLSEAEQRVESFGTLTSYLVGRWLQKAKACASVLISLLTEKCWIDDLQIKIWSCRFLVERTIIAWLFQFYCGLGWICSCC